MQDIQADKDRALDFIHQEEKLYKLRVFEQHLNMQHYQQELEKINSQIEELNTKKKEYSDQLEEQKKKNQDIIDCIRKKTEQQKVLEDEQKKIDDQILKQKNEYQDANKKLVQIMKDHERIT